METYGENKASSLSSSIQPKFKYDVFLSFRGEDTRNNFTSHLKAAFEQHGFHTFRDDTKLNRGENIGHELMKAIEESKISVVVLSTDYAASKWCLDELVKIMECRQTWQHTVLPIFYNVEPSDVRAQKGSLAKAFADHEECLKEVSSVRVKKWREALSEIGSLSGWDAPKVANGDEAHLVRKVVEEVQNKLNLLCLHVASHEVGLESRLEKLKTMLGMEPHDVRIVAIHGMGGIGKTTIAKKLYNLIEHEFQGRSFLANIRETSKQHNGLVSLQEQLLCDILRTGTHSLRNFHQGIEVIKRRAFCCKVLLILDDVDDVEQLKALAIDQGSFCSGSRIIITTRDISSLNLLKVDEIYAAEELNKDESLELFSWYCFKEEHPPEDRLDLSRKVVHYAGGLPLALEVLGCYIYDKSIPEWKSAISKLKKIPHDKIQEKLKISFDSLGEEEKKLFLDIACFFVGRNGDSVVKILEDCQKYAVNGIRDLANRCLVKYNGYQLKMHDVVRDMGREIVKRESPDDPGKRSRLWDIEDVLEVLRDGTGTESVKGLFLNAQPFDRLRCHENALVVWRDGMVSEAVENFTDPKDVQVNAKAFEKMNNLWLLHLDYICLTTGYEHISRRLLWLSWKGFPLQRIPQNFYMEKLVALDLRYSNLNEVWSGNKVLNNLKFLYLSHCHYLTRTPDFSGLKSLEELLLNDCKSLMEVDESIICLNKLVILDMRNCVKLRKLPFGILTLKSLKSLDLSGCSMLGKYFGFKGSTSKFRFPFLSSWILRTKRMDSIGLSLSPIIGSSSLKELRMANCNLSSLPNDVGNLISLINLDLSGNNLYTLPDSFWNLVHLERLTLSNCNLSSLPNEVGDLISLENLDLSGNKLHTLPDSFCNLVRLKGLLLNDCNLSSLPNEVGNLISLSQLNLSGNNLHTLPDSLCNLVRLKDLLLENCNLSHLPDRIGMLSSLVQLLAGRNTFCSLPISIRDLASLQNLQLPGCRRLQSLPQLPVNLMHVEASYCTSLESIPTKVNKQTGLRAFLHECNMLAMKDFAANVVGIGRSDGENKVSCDQEASKDSNVSKVDCICLLGDEVPNCFLFQCTGSRFSLQVPLLETWTIQGYSLCIIFRTREHSGLDFPVDICSNNLHFSLFCYIRPQGKDQMLLVRSAFPKIHLYGGNELVIEIKPWGTTEQLLTVKKWGINFTYDDDDDDDDEGNTEMPIKKKRKITEMKNDLEV